MHVCAYDNVQRSAVTLKQSTIYILLSPLARSHMSLLIKKMQSCTCLTVLERKTCHNRSGCIKKPEPANTETVSSPEAAVWVLVYWHRPGVNVCNPMVVNQGGAGKKACLLSIASASLNK